MHYLSPNHGRAVRNSSISASSRYLTMVFQSYEWDAELRYVHIALYSVIRPSHRMTSRREERHIL